MSGRRTGREAASRPLSRWRAKSSGHPFALTIATARSCYAARPVSVEDVVATFDPAVDAMAAEVLEERRERAAELSGGLVAAGRHTTLQHASFVFVLDGVSRLAIWSFLHAHPGQPDPFAHQLDPEFINLDVLQVKLSRLDEVLVHPLTVLAGTGLPGSNGALIEPKGGDDGLNRTAVAQQRAHQRHQIRSLLGADRRACPWWRRRWYHRLGSDTAAPSGQARGCCLARAALWWDRPGCGRIGSIAAFLRT